MRLRTFLTCKVLAIFSLTCTLESNELSFPFLEVSHSADRGTRLNLTDSTDYYSQAAQDKFVYMILYGLLGKQDQGYYLEIGAGDPINTSNSYFFEKKLKWNGVSIDISQGMRSSGMLSETIFYSMRMLQNLIIVPFCNLFQKS